ncbi:HAD hydrolase family protein [Streptococcus pluranimalium]|uniref:HAD hydrolase family protein n=1 Tax=Streptococcus pluranimalium TaxID=82348 RepID=UPI003F68BD9B
MKVFATDMDGTFLNSQNDYDRLRFKKIFEEMKASGVRFVAISGNQYHQIRSFFKDVEDQMTIVGDNGAYIVEKGVLFIVIYDFNRCYPSSYRLCRKRNSSGSAFTFW